MIIIKVQGPMAAGKTTMSRQIRRMLQQEGTTWRERLAFWLLKKSEWNKFQIRAGDMHVVINEGRINTGGNGKLISNLRKEGVKVLILDGNDE